jgi:pyruvate ferredoxin oxidoreductase delta subunit
VNTRKCRHICGESRPVVGEAGLTGAWRLERPVIQLAKCSAAKSQRPVCLLCWLYCPEAVISKTVPPQIDLKYCKGCGICAAECPRKAIAMVPENPAVQRGETQ